ncbi:hypothetical protein BH11ACT6_BH11ACT6_50850 [soil metagenome]
MQYAELNSGIQSNVSTEVTEIVSGSQVMASTVAPVPAVVDPVELLRRFEPVIRYTEGELFFPMAVDAYVEQAALWGRAAGERERRRLADHGELDLDLLCTVARADVATTLELRYVPTSLTPRELRQWRRDPDRPRFRSTSRFAAVGLLGRIIDSLFRLSLILRGSVPGGLTAALHRRYRSSSAATTYPYYGHVSSDGGYVVLQYWFFYAMNDWRSTFGGVNDHEADWEQVTVFLVPPVEGTEHTNQTDGSDALRVGWVAFSSHDERGDDLRRRFDDPDITWVDHTHPVVHAGAGSHSGAYLPGEYLVRVEPLALRRFLAVVGRARVTLFPWTRDRPAPGVGIPYVDYKRGDGVQIGPGTAHSWTPVLIDSETSWVRDFSGLWGLDTDDPFGGERAPAGPRYERNGKIRPSWADPVGWAGLDKVPATAAEHERAVEARLSALHEQRETLSAELATGKAVLQQLSVGGGASELLPAQEAALADLRAARRAVVIEHEHLSRARQEPPPPVGVHAHLRRRALPNVDPDRPPGMLLRFWTEVSLSVLLALLGSALILGETPLLRVGVAAVIIVVTVEALLRHRLGLLLLGLGVLGSIAGIVFMIITNLRAAIGVLLLLAAFALLIANLRATLGRR